MRPCHLLSLACILVVQSTLLAAAQPAPSAIPQTLHLRMVAEIGGDLVGEAYVLNRVGDIAVSSTGEIFVLDSGDKQVKVYGAEGGFVRRFGREGGGPGEFLLPGRITIDSLVHVFDGQQQRVALFTLDGSHRDTRRLPAMSDPLPSEIYPLRGGALVGLAPARFSSSLARNQPNHLVTYRAPGATDSEVLFSYRSAAIDWHSVGEAYASGLLTGGFGDGGALAVHGDSLLALADGYSGQVTWFAADAGGLIKRREARIPLASVPVTDLDLRAAERKFREERDSQLPRRLQLDGPPRWSVASRALFGDDGSLWIQSAVDAEPGDVWSVFPPANESPRLIRMPPNFDLRAIHRDRMYGVSSTANDAHRVRVFEWSWR